jgi:hypothetical protein
MKLIIYTTITFFAFSSPLHADAKRVAMLISSYGSETHANHFQHPMYERFLIQALIEQGNMKKPKLPSNYTCNVIQNMSKISHCQK